MKRRKDISYGGITRRELLGKMAAGLTFITVNSIWGPISPAEARARGAQLSNLTTAEAATLEALGEALVPGARAAGIAYYVDDQLGRHDPLLFLKYTDYIDLSYLEFYRRGLKSLQDLSASRYGRAFDPIDPLQKTSLIRELSQSDPAGWGGLPPAPLFYFVTRNDAVDVVYGTPEGFRKLGVPYMALLAPAKNW